MIWAIALLVQYHFLFCELVLSNRSSAVSLTDFCVCRGEKKQACLVLLKLNPPAQRPFSRIDLQLEELPVWTMLSLQLNGISIQESWIDGDTMTVPWYRTTVNNRSVLVLTTLHSGFVERPSASINFFFVPSLSLLSTWHACQNVIPSYCSVGFCLHSWFHTSPREPHQPWHAGLHGAISSPTYCGVLFVTF